VNIVHSSRLIVIVIIIILFAHQKKKNNMIKIMRRVKTAVRNVTDATKARFPLPELTGRVDGSC